MLLNEAAIFIDALVSDLTCKENTSQAQTLQQTKNLLVHLYRDHVLFLFYHHYF